MSKLFNIEIMYIPFSYILHIYKYLNNLILPIVQYIDLYFHKVMYYNTKKKKKNKKKYL